jgi:site-specific DNA-methyltransferase (adenine-specific)
VRRVAQPVRAAAASLEHARGEEEHVTDSTEGGGVEPIYRSSKAVVYQGDVLTVLPQVAPESVHAVIADPPYCSGGINSANRTRQSPRRKYNFADDLPDFDGDQRDQRSFTYWSALWLTDCHRATKPGGVLMVFTDWRQLPSVTDAIQAAGWIWRGIIAWHKPAARVQLGRFTNSCEYIVWASKGPLSPTGNPPLPGMYSHSAPHHSKRIHITEKHVLLLRKLAKVVASGGVILDPFAGSGSTGAAALLEGRRFIGIELSPHYAEQTAARLDAIEHGDTGSDAGGA